MHQKSKLPETPKIWTPHSIRRWTKESKRLFMEHFAKIRSGDPLSASFWYSVSRAHLSDAVSLWSRGRGGIVIIILTSLQGGKSLLETYPSYIAALRDIFPEVQFDEFYLPIVSRMSFFIYDIICFSLFHYLIIMFSCIH